MLIGALWAAARLVKTAGAATVPSASRRVSPVDMGNFLSGPDSIAAGPNISART
jgi:hypothetical protein